MCPFEQLALVFQLLYYKENIFIYCILFACLNKNTYVTASTYAVSTVSEHESVSTGELKRARVILRARKKPVVRREDQRKTKKKNNVYLYIKREEIISKLSVFTLFTVYCLRCVFTPSWSFFSWLVACSWHFTLSYRKCIRCDDSSYVFSCLHFKYWLCWCRSHFIVNNFAAV